jgi:ArsR family transcriptional regulator
MRSADPDVLMLAALADPNRLEIVRQLGAQSGATCACDFTECCSVSQPTVSHHLKVLRDAGVLVSERRGTNIYYSLAPSFAERFRSLGASIGGLVQIG